MSIEQVKDTDLVYYLVAYDKDGRERDDDPDGVMSDRITKAIRDEQVTDVFVISHGWKGDIPAARDQYSRWIKAMADCEADRREIRRRRPDFKSLIVGFHWPSLPHGDEEFGVGAPSFAVPGAVVAAAPDRASANDVATQPLAPAVETFVDLYADRIADTPRARDAIRTIVTHAMTAGPAVDALPGDVAAAYHVLNDEAGMGGTGPAGHPGEDREPFDANRAYRNARTSAATLTGAPGAGPSPAFGGGGASVLLAPLRQLSYWKMKDRARTIGESAGFTLLKNMMAAAPAGRKVRFHLMGHSFGCIVVSGMVHGPNGTGVLPQPVSSLTLVQGATSLWGFCAMIPEADKPGYFRKIIEQKRVEGPIITTQSKRDTAIGRLYPLAAGVALQVDFPAGQFPKYGGLGSWGLQGPGLTVRDLAIADAAHDYKFEPAHIYNLECTSVIKDGTGASGAHSDIAKPETAHALWEAVKAS